MRLRKIIAPAVVALAAGIAIPATSANAAFTSCPSGASGTGRACLWTNANYLGNPSHQAASTQTGLSINARSFGNRITNRCAVWYSTGGAALTTSTPYNFGNSWGSTVTVGSVDIFVC